MNKFLKEWDERFEQRQKELRKQAKKVNTVFPNLFDSDDKFLSEFNHYKHKYISDFVTDKIMMQGVKDVQVKRKDGVVEEINIVLENPEGTHFVTM